MSTTHTLSPHQTRSAPPELIERLKEQFGDRLSLTVAVREHHGTDESPYPSRLPDAVLFAESTDDVVALVNLCRLYKTPIVAYGAGSSLEGQILPVQGGITLNLSKLNQIIRINPEDLSVTVQAGVTRKQLNTELRDTGLFFPIDPGADASLGGMVATRASGTNAVRYGTMRENTLSLTVVTADGQVVKTSSRAKKSSSGYDLTRLFIGSEGTLGIITEVTVKLYPQPEATAAAICHFPSVELAVNAVIQTIQLGVEVARVELMNKDAVIATNQYSKLALNESPLLLFEFIGSPTALSEQASIVQDICTEYQGQDFQWAHEPEARSKLWTARHNAYFAGLQLRPDCRCVTTDVCVPISRLADCITETERDLAMASFPSTIVGHVGDGNFHTQMLIAKDSDAEWQEAEAINHRLVERAIAMDGTCSGEHGVGLHKMQFMELEHGLEGVALMRQIKHCLDPDNILNPSKIITW